MKIAFVIYRKWAFEILKKISSSADTIYLITNKKAEFSLTEAKKYSNVYLIDENDNDKIYRTLQESKVDVVFFYGWSWIIKNNVLDNFLSLCLHPSPLPKYRGGSPIQHQLLNNEKTSAVSVFKMDQSIDAGDIYMQLPMSLSGDIHDIFKRMTNLGVKITRKFIVDYKKGNVKFTPQKNLNKYPPLKRREPEESEIKKEDLKNISFDKLHNLVRGLLDPFPNAYIIYDNKRINILKIKKVRGVQIVKDITNSKEEIFLRLKDSIVKIIDYKISNANL